MKRFTTSSSTFYDKGVDKREFSGIHFLLCQGLWCASLGCMNALLPNATLAIVLDSNQCQYPKRLSVAKCISYAELKDFAYRLNIDSTSRTVRKTIQLIFL